MKNKKTEEFTPTKEVIDFNKPPFDLDKRLENGNKLCLDKIKEMLKRKNPHAVLWVEIPKGKEPKIGMLNNRLNPEIIAFSVLQILKAGDESLNEFEKVKDDL
jgi:hypothetical protein